jgi:hypothetical protein
MPGPDVLLVRHLRRTGLVFLLALITLTLAVEGSQRLHTHDSDTAGLYNSDCPLAALTGCHQASPLPEPLSSTWVALVVGVAAPAPRALSPASPLRHTESRAPPAPLA